VVAPLGVPWACPEPEEAAVPALPPYPDDLGTPCGPRWSGVVRDVALPDAQTADAQKEPRSLPARGDAGKLAVPAQYRPAVVPPARHSAELALVAPVAAHGTQAEGPSAA